MEANKKRKIERTKKSETAKLNKKVVKYFFTKIDSDTYRCKKCQKELAQKKGTGTTNLMNHLNFKHSSYQEEMDKGEVPTIQFATPKAQNMYSWLDWIITGGLPFSSVSDPLFRKYSKLQAISLDSYMKYMSLLTRNVEEVIRNILPDIFSLIFDGWTLDGTSTHFIALYASFMVFVVVVVVIVVVVVVVVL